MLPSRRLMAGFISSLLEKASPAAAAHTSSSSSVYSASNPPSHVYKILEHHAENPRYAFPIPIPAGFEFPTTELDAKDGFMHMSTAPQLEATLTRFFRDAPAVTLLKCDYGRLSGFKRVQWEKSGSGSEFPHLYALLEGENVESFKELVREKTGENSFRSWENVLDAAKREGWLQ